MGVAVQAWARQYRGLDALVHAHGHVSLVLVKLALRAGVHGEEGWSGGPDMSVRGGSVLVSRIFRKAESFR